MPLEPQVAKKKIDDLPHTQKKGNAWSGVRTHADKRPADLKSAPLDPSGIQAIISLEGLEPPIF